MCQVVRSRLETILVSLKYCKNKNTPAIPLKIHTVENQKQLSLKYLLIAQLITIGSANADSIVLAALCLSSVS